MSLLENAFYALDTPGAYARGALSGRLGERASGEDVLHAWGVNDPNKWAGIAAEMVLDPINLIPGGLGLKALRGVKAAKTANKATKILIKRGAMPANLARSTVVGRRGKPTALYHGTQFPFDKVDLSKVDPEALYGPGFYNTTDPKVASGYAATKSVLPGMDDTATAAEIAKYYAPGRKLGPYLSSGREKVYHQVIRHDTKAGRVYTKNLGDGTESSFFDVLSKGEYVKAFGPSRGPHVRKSFMHSRKVFDVDSALSKSDYEAIHKAVSDAGLPRTKEGLDGMYQGAWEKGVPHRLDKEELYDDLTRLLEHEIKPDVDLPIARQAKAVANQILRAAGYDSIKHVGGGALAGATKHNVHIGLLGESQMFKPWVAPGIRKVPKAGRQIGLLAAGLGGYQGTKIGFRHRREQQIGIRP